MFKYCHLLKSVLFREKIQILMVLEEFKSFSTWISYTKYNYQSKHNKNYCIMFYNMFYNYMFRPFSLGHLQVVYTRPWEALSYIQIYYIDDEISVIIIIQIYYRLIVAGMKVCISYNRWRIIFVYDSF